MLMLDYNGNGSENGMTSNYPPRAYKMSLVCKDGEAHVLERRHGGNRKKT